MKTVFITGATAGFGAASARRFAAAGWRVIGTGRR
ncbi:MAG TPA: SDR family NAD(P)-dependent oxidoreductase, partial [Allosphingosinicella sp.]|nr:SDR family NAD(P)-dependent oxidoreductase [Allosphingosinicella sp.]